MMIPSNTKQESNGGEKGTSGTAAGTGLGHVSTPTISLPKGGGAIRGIGEKFSVNPARGTGSLTVPIFTVLADQTSIPNFRLDTTPVQVMVRLVSADNQATWLFPRSVNSRFAVRWINRFFGSLWRRRFGSLAMASCLGRVIDESDKFSALKP